MDHNFHDGARNCLMSNLSVCVCLCVCVCLSVGFPLKHGHPTGSPAYLFYKEVV